MTRRAASLVLLAAAAAQSPYSAEQQQEFERTRQELLAMDNLHHKVSYHLSTKLVARKPPSDA